MRILAVDVGERRIGLAVSDELGISGTPLPPLRNGPGLWKEINSILEQYRVQYIVIGMPYQLSGAIGSQGERVQAWAETLKQHADVPVEFVDERMTTLLAERVLIEGDVRRRRRREMIDSLAALLILQTYLERLRKDERE